MLRYLKVASRLWDCGCPGSPAVFTTASLVACLNEDVGILSRGLVAGGYAFVDKIRVY